MLSDLANSFFGLRTCIFRRSCDDSFNDVGRNNNGSRDCVFDHSESLLELLKLNASLEESLVGDSVSLDLPLLHFVELLQSDEDLLSLDAGLDHARVDDDARSHSETLHFVEDAEGLRELLRLPVDFDQDAELQNYGLAYRHVRRLDLLFPHRLVHGETEVELVRLAASVEKAVVEHFVRLDVMLLHRLEHFEGLFDPLSGTASAAPIS